MLAGQSALVWIWPDPLMAWDQQLASRPLLSLSPQLPVQEMPKAPRESSEKSPRRVVVLAYCEMRDTDQSNLEFFIRVALRQNTPGMYDSEGHTDYIIVASGETCTPCEETLPRVLALSGRTGEWVTVLRRPNRGADMGAHGHAIRWLRNHRKGVYQYFIFLNSSLRGPFMPGWTPRSVHFTDLLVNPMQQDKALKLIGPYLACMPNEHAELGTVEGPELETAFICLDQESLDWALKGGVFGTYDTKREMAVKTEGRLTAIVREKGGRLETLLTRYKRGIDWLDPQHWMCNDRRMPSRRGALSGGVTVSPFEVLFLKVNWCVRATEVAQLSKWLVRLAAGQAGTEGVYDRRGYLWGEQERGTTSIAGELPPDVPLDNCRLGDVSDLLIDSSLPV